MGAAGNDSGIGAQEGRNAVGIPEIDRIGAMQEDVGGRPRSKATLAAAYRWVNKGDGLVFSTELLDLYGSTLR